MLTRRQTLGFSSAMLAGAAFAGIQARAASPAEAAGDAAAPSGTPSGYRPVVTPNGASLPFHVRDGVKIFHLTAGPVDHQFAPGLVAACWGYNGRVHGPTIEAVEGDRVRVYVTNRLPAPTTVHWHGVLLPSGMDGVGGLSQPVILPGETFVYEWTFVQHGTFMYHSHHDEAVQMGMGLMGMIVVHPKNPDGPPPDRDYVFMLSEWYIEPGTRRPDPRRMSDFNLLTMNAKAFPATEPIAAQTGERVRIRFGNLSAMDHHPIHLHGNVFHLTGTDGGPVPSSARLPETTVLVPVGTTRTVELVASHPGDWAMHCHMTHHVMNQMGHAGASLVGLGQDEPALQKIAALVPGYQPMGVAMTDAAAHEGHGHHGQNGMTAMAVPENSIPMMGGAGPHGGIGMGGMMTVLKVRDRLSGAGDPGWYHAPAGTQARRAQAGEIARDGIEI